LIYEIFTNSRNRNPRAYLDKLYGLHLLRSPSVGTLLREEITHGRRTHEVWNAGRSDEFADFVKNGRGKSLDSQVDDELMQSIEFGQPNQLKEAIDGMWNPKFDALFATIQRAQTPLPMHKTI
jgi:hypothetical protein